LLNQRGGRLSVKSAHDIITTIAAAAGLEDDDITAHVLRHTFATRLVRGRTDLRSDSRRATAIAARSWPQTTG
jgi:site-specific recombinase XerD